METTAPPVPMEPLPESVGPFDTADLLISATRYYIGRRTIATCWHAMMLAKAWPSIHVHTRSVIRRDLEEAFRDDDHARAEGEPYTRRLGDDCDRAEWEKVRAAYLADPDLTR